MTRHQCKDCTALTTATWCRDCGYKNRKRPSGLKYELKVVNKAWIKPGEQLNPATQFKPQGKPWNHGAGYLDYTASGKTIKHHRHVMQQHLGRELKPEEDVHHIDGDKSNNDISNLQLFASRSEHIKHHWETNWVARRKTTIT